MFIQLQSSEDGADVQSREGISGILVLTLVNYPRLSAKARPETYDCMGAGAGVGWSEARWGLFTFVQSKMIKIKGGIKTLTTKKSGGVCHQKTPSGAESQI